MHSWERGCRCSRADCRPALAPRAIAGRAPRSRLSATPGSCRMHSPRRDVDWSQLFAPGAVPGPRSYSHSGYTSRHGRRRRARVPAAPADRHVSHPAGRGRRGSPRLRHHPGGGRSDRRGRPPRRRHALSLESSGWSSRISSPSRRRARHRNSTTSDGATTPSPRSGVPSRAPRPSGCRRWYGLQEPQELPHGGPDARLSPAAPPASRVAS